MESNNVIVTILQKEIKIIMKKFKYFEKLGIFL